MGFYSIINSNYKAGLNFIVLAELIGALIYLLFNENDNKAIWFYAVIIFISLILLSSFFLDKETINFLIVPLVVAVIGAAVSYTQIISTEENARNERKLLLLQIFHEQLSIGNMIQRNHTLKLMSLYSDSIDVKQLYKISNETAIMSAGDSLWGKTIEGRENAIRELANLYYDTTYSRRVIKKLYDRVPIPAFINEWAPVISISKFFYALKEYGNGYWEGSQDDWEKFAELKESRFYKEKIKDSSNVKSYLDYGLSHFKKINK